MHVCVCVCVCVCVECGRELEIGVKTVTNKQNWYNA